jgi:hypothetical protein
MLFTSFTALIKQQIYNLYKNIHLVDVESAISWIGHLYRLRRKNMTEVVIKGKKRMLKHYTFMFVVAIIITINQEIKITLFGKNEYFIY